METLQQQKTPQKASYGSRSSVSNAAIAYPSRTIVHAKLEMTEPGDHDELEADAAANDIVSGGKIRRKISNGGGSGISVSPQVESQIAQLQGGGHAMPAGLRNMMENGFGRDFSQVRLHTDSQAADMSSSISARAFTHGNDIYFNRGQFSPNTAEGQRLVAHELTHVAQGTGKVGREENEENDMNSLIIKMCNDETSQEKSKNYAKEFVKDKKGKGAIASGGSLSMTGDKCNLFVYNVLFRAYLEKTKKEKKDGKTQFDIWHFLKDKGKVAPKTVSNIYKDVVFSDNSILRKIDDIKDVKPGDIVIWTFKEEKNGIIKLPHHIEIVAGISDSGKEKSWSLSSFGAHPNGAYKKSREITEVQKRINIENMYVDKERKKLLPKEKKEEGAKLYSLKEGITEINTKYNCGEEGPIEFYRFEGELTHVVQGTGKVGRKDLSSYKDIVKGIFKDADSFTFDTIWEHYIKYKDAFEMDNDWNLAHFFAQVYGESSHLTPKETISYSVYRLAELFSAFRENGKPNADAWRLGLFDEKIWEKKKNKKNKSYWSEDDLNKHPAKTSISSEEQKEIASISYANKYGNGDKNSGDGWRYRGRGLLQLTFKDNYKRRQETINELTKKNIDIVNNPDEVSNNLEISALTAMAYWHDRKLHTKCENKMDTKEMTDAINKGADDKTRKKRQDAFDTIASGIGLN